jgi:hypothetical protein
MCRSYGCWRILIFDSGGKPVGRITGPRILRTKDERLKCIWAERIEQLDPSDQERWDSMMEDILLEEGYSIGK